MPPEKHMEPERIYCDNIALLVPPSGEEFYFVLRSGDHIAPYILSPKHAKRFLLLLQKNMKEYEDVHGILETELPSTGVPSPIQVRPATEGDGGKGV